MVAIGRDLGFGWERVATICMRADRIESARPAWKRQTIGVGIERCPSHWDDSRT
jgi:hypothetical protein